MSTFATISTLDLDTVTGGASSSGDQTATALQGITDQLASLKNDSGKKSGGFNDPATMMMFCMALSQRNQGGSNTTVIAGGGAPAPAQTVRTSTRIHW